MKDFEEKKKMKISNYLFIFTIIIILIILYAKFVEVKKIETREYRVVSDQLPKEFSGFKIIHISDIYYGSTIELSDIKKMVKNINILKPDLVVFTGNLISPHKKITEKEKNDLINELKKINTLIGKYYVNGEHDEEISHEILNNSDFDFTEKKQIYYKGMTPILLVGIQENTLINDYLYQFEESNVEINEALNEFDQNLQNNIFKIVLTSKGDISSELLKLSIKPNMILAGNSLGGTINIPFYGPLLLPNGSEIFYGEYYKKENVDIFVSNGIGTNKYEFRLFNKPSFNFYRLKSI